MAHRFRLAALPLAVLLACAPDASDGNQASPYERGLAALDSGDPSTAVSFLEQAVEVAPGDATVWNDLGRAHYANRDYELAIESHARAFSLDSSVEEYRFRQGIAHIELNQFVEAQAEFEAVLEMNPEHRDSWNDLGFTLNRLGEFERAIPHFDKTIELDPDIPNPYAHRAYSLTRLGRLDEAEADLRESESRSQEYNKNHFYWACYHALRGDTEAALTRLGTAVELGFGWADWIESEAALESLRGEVRFIELLAQASEL